MADAAVGAPASSRGTSNEGSDRLISIGQLVRELQPDFPDLSISKVRYLEDRGLVTPKRTKGKYRKYSRPDVKRLRAVLSMQRDEYLPLDVIRRRMDGYGSGSGGMQDSVAHGDTPIMSLAHDAPVYSLDEFCKALGVDEDFVNGLLEFRLVEKAADSGSAFTEGDLEAARICQRLGQFQVEPRHLRMLSSAAEREAGLIEQIATPDLRSGHADRREYGVQTAQELGTLIAQLTRVLLQRELRRAI